MDPGVKIKEIDRSFPSDWISAGPVCLIFGLSPRGTTYQREYVSNINQYIDAFGYPRNAAEAYFFTATRKLLNAGGSGVAYLCKMPIRTSRTSPYYGGDQGGFGINGIPGIYDEYNLDEDILFSI